MEHEPSTPHLSEADPHLYNLRNVQVNIYESCIVIKRPSQSKSLFIDKKSMKIQEIDDTSSLKLKGKLDTYDYSLFLGMICIEECYFLVFVKKVAFRGKLFGHKIYEIESVKFISLNVTSC